MGSRTGLSGGTPCAGNSTQLLLNYGCVFCCVYHGAHRSTRVQVRSSGRSGSEYPSGWSFRSFSSHTFIALKQETMWQALFPLASRLVVIVQITPSPRTSLLVLEDSPERERSVTATGGRGHLVGERLVLFRSFLFCIHWGTKSGF